MLIPLKLVRDQQLQQQIFEQLRDLIVSRRLSPATRMPSTRMMAEQFSISRMTVLLAYERLIAEGYLETRPAAGTFVARQPVAANGGAALPASALSLAHAATAASDDHAAGGTRDGDPPGNAPGNAPGHAAGAGPEGRVGTPDPSLFPAQRWRSLMRSEIDHMGSHLGADHPAGSPGLREAIANWLAASRGLAVSRDQVLVLKGRQQAMHVAARLASHPCEGRRSVTHSGAPLGTSHTPTSHGVPPSRDGHLARDDSVRIVVEDPCDKDAAAALAAEGATLIRVPVDADGIRTNLLPETDAVLVHVVPEHQCPLGVRLSRDRRLALLDWAARAGALVLESDIDGELRYGQQDTPPLMSLDASERVIFLGGFGLSLGPWLDIAYLVLPRWLAPFALAALRLIDDSRNGLEQLALTEFMNSGSYPRHLHRLTKAYASRRDALLAALRRHLDPAPIIWGTQASLHVAWFPGAGLGSPEALAHLGRHCGLEMSALRTGAGARALLLGFGHLPERQLEARVAHFAGSIARRAAG